MRVEVTDQVAPVTDLQAVRAEQFAQERCQTSLSGALLAALDIAVPGADVGQKP